MQFLLQEKVYKAHYRSQMEPIDCIVKDMARLCVDTCNASHPATLMASMQPLHDRFWLKFPKASKILREWLRVAKDAFQVNTSLSVVELQEQIWKNFLTRLSLDIWFVTDDKSHGNDMLRLICDVTQDTLYGTFPMINSLAGLPQCKPRMVRPPAPTAYLDNSITSRSSNTKIESNDESTPRLSYTRSKNVKSRFRDSTSPKSTPGGLLVNLTDPTEEVKADVTHDLAYSDSDSEV